eukprot:gene6281-8649_t
MTTFHYQPNSWVWIQDEEERYLPAKVLKAFQKGEPTTVMTEDGEQRTLNAAQSSFCEECNPEAMDSGIQDLINISDLNEMSILHNLRIRFKEDLIYTNISSILISVNPFKLLPLYTPEMLDRYRNGSRGLPPHVFAIAINAYNNMVNDSADQSVVISGESGAGKSEATKLILQFLTDVSAKVAGHPSSSSTLEQQILAANPILEAFGNAKTLRNNNSSRFGKLITVNFDKNGSIIGGGIINYLLEKSRVVQQTKGERNYHIFYQLLSAADTDPELTAKLDLKAPELFTFTGTSGVSSIEGMSDEKEFDDVRTSMDILRFTTEEKSTILSIVAGVLHFGNLKFKVEKNSTGDDSSSIVNTDVLSHASKLWGCDPSQMEKFLTNRYIGTRSIILVAYNINQAQDARDAMVKRVYAELFQFIVNKINIELSKGGQQRHKFIGVLDIFGFESFEVNSFEQLCINFCNEKLQFHFNEHIFKMEQTLYASEGISIPGTAFVDNQPTLDLLEARTTGIFSMTDEEINVPKGSDDGLLQKILKNHGAGTTAHPNMIKPKANNCKDFLKNFGILHYAGPVFYNITNFLEKNKDQLHSDIQNVLRDSKLPLISSMFPADAVDESNARSRTAGKAPGKSKTLGGQFKVQLNELIATLNSTFPHFVRCMKSNDKKAGNIFTASRMQDQLRYAGLVEVCRIRKLGFPVRRPFDEFFKRYRCIELLSPNLDALNKVLEAKGILKKGEWAKGNTRMFMRTLQNAELESAREHSLVKVATIVQKYGRRYNARNKMKYFKKILGDVNAAIIKREEKELSSVIDISFELPWGGNHLPKIKEAKVLLIRLKEEKRVTQLLENAILSKDLNSLKSAIAEHAAVNPPFITPLAAEAQAIVVRLEAELALKAELTVAIAQKIKVNLISLVAKAKQMSFECNEVFQAITLIERLEQEEALIAKLKEAMQAEDLHEISKYISECLGLGIDNQIVKQAKDLKAKLIEIEKAKQIAEEERRKREEEEEKERAAQLAAEAKRSEQIELARANLRAAISSKNVSQLNSSLQAAIQIGTDIPEVAEARAFLDNLVLVEEARSKLQAALKVLQVKVESGIDEIDMQPLVKAISHSESVSKIAGEFPELLEAREMFVTFQKHVKARADLEAAVASKDRSKLRTALDNAEDLEMQIGLMVKVREMIKELEGGRTAATASAAPGPGAAPQPYDAAEEARKMRQEIAKQARFDIKNFQNLRTADDFARGAILNKSKIKEQFLTFQPNVIPKSLTDLNKDSNKLALQIHKDLLGYMGDKQLPFPAMLAQDILRKGYEYKPIRDEIYLQIIKQLTNNPRPESVAKGWQVMCMCVGTFPPSQDFENFLLHYIIEKRDRGRGAVIDYARYCLRTLEAMLNSGDGTGFVPSVEEILAYKERPPILATIYLVDGNVITENLPLTPDLNVGKVLEMCSGWLDLKDPRINTLGMFVYDLGEVEDVRMGEDPYAKAPYADLKRTPRPLRNEDYMGDTIVQKARQRRKFKFVLKRKIFLPKYNYRGDDPFFERMTYLQAEDEAIIQGNIEISDINEAVHLAAISMAVAFGEEMPGTVDEMVEGSVVDFIPPHWRDSKSPQAWAEMILQFRDSLVYVEPDDLQEKFLNIVQRSAAYGSHWFFAHKLEPQSYAGIPPAIQKLPYDLILAFNSEGMHIYTFSRHLIMSFPYSDICRWGGSSSQFSLIMADDQTNESYEFVLITSQAADMAAIILDHIRAIMAEQESQDA